MNDIILRFIPIFISWTVATIVMNSLRKKYNRVKVEKFSASNVISFEAHKKNKNNCYYMSDFKKIS